MQGSPPQTSTLVSIPGNASYRSRTTHCKTWAFSARLSFERSVSTSRSGLMMRHTPGEAVHMLETSWITLHHQESSSIEPCRRSRHLSQSPFAFLTTDGFLDLPGISANAGEN